jgi:hypothetical protein
MVPRAQGKPIPSRAFSIAVLFDHFVAVMPNCQILNSTHIELSIATNVFSIVMLRSKMGMLLNRL